MYVATLGFELPFKTVEIFEVLDAVTATDADKTKSLVILM